MQTPIERGNINPATDKAYFVRVTKMLILPFNAQEAYHLGLVDSNGNPKKEPSSQNEKDAYTELHQLIFGLKRFILSKPGGTNLLKRTSIALNAIIRTKNKKLEARDIQSILESHGKNESFIIDNDISLLFEEGILEHVVSLLEDSELPTNTTAGVAQKEPPLGPMFKRKKKLEDVVGA